MHHDLIIVVFFFNDTATTEIYTLSLHDALPILRATMSQRRASFISPTSFPRSTRVSRSSGSSAFTNCEAIRRYSSTRPVGFLIWRTPLLCLLALVDAPAPVAEVATAMLAHRQAAPHPGGAPFGVPSDGAALLGYCR